jgi:hypothetical protein
MKINRYYLLIIATLSFTTIVAQQTIDPTLEVRRDYDGRLMEITKSNLITTYSDSLNYFDIGFDYSFFEKPVKKLYDFTPMSAGMPKQRRETKQPFLFLRLGSDYPLNPYGDLHIQPDLGKKFSVILSASSNNYMDQLPVSHMRENKITPTDQKSAAPSTRNDAALTTKFKWKSGETGARFKFSHNKYSYYGFDKDYIDLSGQTDPQFSEIDNQDFMRENLSHRTNIAEATLFSRSILNENRIFNHDLSISYSLLNEKSPDTPNPFAATNIYPASPPESEEKYLDIQFDAGVRFAGFNKIMTGVRYEASNTLGKDSLDRSNLELHPRYIFNKGGWKFDVGFKYNMWWDKDQQEYNIYPSIKAEYEMINERLWVYGVLDGKNNFMNLHKLSKINPWHSPEVEIKNTEQPVIARAGIKGNIIERISYNLYGEYTEFKNRQYFYYINGEYLSEHPINSFGAVYANEKRSGITAELEYTGSNFRGSLKSAIYSFRDDNNMTDNHFHYSPFVMSAHLQYNIRKRLYFDAFVSHRQKAPILTAEIISTNEIMPNTHTPSYTCINIGATYMYSSKINFFVKLDNILDSEIYDYAFYAMPGINGGAGIEIKF